MREIGTDRSYIIDSCGWIEYFKGGPKADEFGNYIERSDTKTHYTPTIILFEVYKVFLRNYGDDEALNVIGHIKKNSTIMPLDDNIGCRTGGR